MLRDLFREGDRLFGDSIVRLTGDRERSRRSGLDWDRRLRDNFLGRGERERFVLNFLLGDIGDRDLLLRLRGIGDPLLLPYGDLLRSRWFRLYGVRSRFSFGGTDRFLGSIFEDSEPLFRRSGDGDRLLRSVALVLGGVERFRLEVGDIRRLFRSLVRDFEEDGCSGETDRFRSIFNGVPDCGPFNFLGERERRGCFFGVSDCFGCGVCDRFRSPIFGDRFPLRCGEFEDFLLAVGTEID